AIARRFVQEIDNYFASARRGLMRHVLHTPPERWNEDEISKLRDCCVAELDLYEREMRGEFLAGPLSAADFSLYPLLISTLDTEREKPDLAISSHIGPGIGTWMKRIEALPYFERTLPPNVNLPIFPSGHASYAFPGR
ncbi:MAG: hypothetical protein ACREUA_09370, partial [Burkholderiales bacterium]